ncbi:MAG TPA: tail fiber domain-containing protein [Blastocatellia bacterium]|nr:tail fiber domain-containing protein [Blastocatellia bacterium]
MRLKSALIPVLSALLCSLAMVTAVSGQTTTFSYQGRLTDGSSLANGVYDMKFSLFDGSNNPQGSPSTIILDNPGVTVTNGAFTVQLDFGSSAFTGGTRFLEISARPHSADPNTPGYTTLSPRQQITSAPYAITAANVTGSLSGDVTGTQSATVVSAVGGQTAANVASGAAAANNATNANTPNAIVKRDASGNFIAGTITGSLNGNATGVASTAGNSVITAINGGTLTIDQARISGVVQLAPSTQQTTSSANALINLKLIGSTTLGNPGVNPLLSLSASGTYVDGNTYDKERFRVDNDGGVLAVGDFNSGVSSAPIQGAGTRFMWYPGRAAIRAGQVDGTQWDDPNVGLDSVAFGFDTRANGDFSVAIGNNTIAANTGSVAIGTNLFNSGLDSIVLGYGGTSSTSLGTPRQGAFVFSDNSLTFCDGNAASGCGADTRLHITTNRSFNSRAVGGYFLWTNTSANTGLRLSTESSSSNEYGSFVWTDRSSDTALVSPTQNSTIFRSTGGYTVYTNSALTAGVTIGPGGGAWSTVSDRNMKANFSKVDPRDILRRVLNLPISTWNYKAQDASIRHIGPMAQDFFAAFKVGEDDKHISTIDPDGVAFAAIQGLHEEIKDRDKKIEQQQQQINQLQQQLQREQSVQDALRQLVCADHPNAQVCKVNK